MKINYVVWYVTSLEETYEALRTFEILGIKKRPDISADSCQSVSETLGSSTSFLKDVFHALKVNSILKCKVNDETFQVYYYFLPFFYWWIVCILQVIDFEECGNMYH